MKTSFILILIVIALGFGYYVGSYDKEPTSSSEVTTTTSDTTITWQVDSLKKRIDSLVLHPKIEYIPIADLGRFHIPIDSSRKDTIGKLNTIDTVMTGDTIKIEFVGDLLGEFHIFKYDKPDSTKIVTITDSVKTVKTIVIENRPTYIVGPSLFVGVSPTGKPVIGGGISITFDVKSIIAKLNPWK